MATITHRLQDWLDTVCRMLPGVKQALVLLSDEDKGLYDPVVWPHAALASDEQLVLARRLFSAEIQDLQEHARYEDNTAEFSYPLSLDGRRHAALIIRISDINPDRLTSLKQILAWSAVWLKLLLHNRAGVADAERLLAVVTATLQHDSLAMSAHAGVNALAEMLQSDRVSLGTVHGKSVTVQAISFMSSFDGKSAIVSAIQTVMQDALDDPGLHCCRTGQGSCGESPAFVVLAGESNQYALCSLPLYCADELVGMIVAEHFEGRHAVQYDEGSADQIGRLLGPIIESKQHRESAWHDRLMSGFVSQLRGLLGAGRYRLKTVTVMSVLLLSVLIFGRGEYRIVGDARLEGRIQQSIVSPYDGFVSASHARAGNIVQKGQAIAELDRKQLEIEAAELDGKLQQLTRQKRKALVEGDRSQVKIYGAQVDQVKADQRLLAMQLVRTMLLAPFDGVVIKGDLSRSLGAPVERGQVLFEIAPLDQYRVALSVDERDIRYVKVGQPGELTLYSIAGNSIPFTVTNIFTVAETDKDYVSFRVEADIAGAVDHLRPGMQGTGKISVGHHSLIWMWSRRLVDWARIQLWRFLP